MVTLIHYISETKIFTETAYVQWLFRGGGTIGDAHILPEHKKCFEQKWPIYQKLKKNSGRGTAPSPDPSRWEGTSPWCLSLCARMSTKLSRRSSNIEERAALAADAVLSTFEKTQTTNG